jgi:protein-disulfide isomerase
VASSPPPVPSAAPAPPTASEDDASPPVSPSDPVWGTRTALVTIVEFGDFQCPFSARVTRTLARVREVYGPETVRIVWKNNPLPFHQNARPAAEAAVAVFALAGNDAFWRFHDAAFAHQSELRPDSFEAWARDAGVTDLPAFRAALANHAGVPAIDLAVAEGKAVGVQGTPTFFVNGVLVNGAQPFDTFKKSIDQELDKARAKIAGGTPADRLYTEASKENKGLHPAVREPEPVREDPKVVFRIPVGQGPVRGSPNALVTIIEFSDFECPFCKRVQPTLQALRDKYGTKLRIVWRNEPLPFHPAAEPAAEAALEVRAQKGDAAFWAVHDGFYADPGNLTKPGPSADDRATADVDTIVRIAVEKGGGVSADKIRKAIAQHTHRKELEADSDVVEDFVANGTPHFFINGRRLVGAQPQDRFESLIDEEMAKAEALVAAGTPPASVYDVATKDGQGPPEPEKKDLPSSLPRTDPARGNPRARVIVHEWADFQCPFCARVEPTLAELMKAYGDRIELVWHDLPLPMHPDAPLAAQAAREAYAQKGAAGFWAMHDKMLGDRQKLKREDLDGYAKALKLDMDKWKTALDNASHASEIEQDKSAGNDDGIVGTPAFIIAPANAPSGYFVNGAQGYGKFRKLVERALSEAK